MCTPSVLHACRWVTMLRSIVMFLSMVLLDRCRGWNARLIFRLRSLESEFVVSQVTDDTKIAS